MIEVEIKIRIADPDLIRRKFKKSKASYRFSLTHEDTYYNMPKGLRDFKQTDEALRLRKSARYERKNKKDPGKTEYFLTYKGRKMDTLSKTREEIDLEIEDSSKMKKLLKLLGFQEVLMVKKERELYEIEFQNIKIEALIDYIPVLDQHYIEVELLTDTKEEIEKSRAILFDFLSSLGIQQENSIRKSYLELILEKKEMEKNLL
ncbi:MAG: class IV adenylate cyclase [Promethearchaeota archaeon]|jgi:adenylate cyclase class 2